MSSIRKVLVAVNFTPAAAAAFQYGAFLSRHLGAGMTMLHVVEQNPESADEATASTTVRRPSLSDPHSARRDPLEQIDEGLTQLLATIPEAEATEVRLRVVPGPVVQTVANLARRDFDVVVIGANSAGGCDLGATAMRIMRETPCRCVPIWPNAEGEKVAFAVRPRTESQQQYVW